VVAAKKRINAEQQINMTGYDRLTYNQLTAVLRGLQHVEPADVFADGRDREAFQQANAKLVRLWNQARLEKEN
jgi:hypothetical protein